MNKQTSTTNGTDSVSNDTIRLLLDCSRGIYIPAKFVECYDLREWGLDPADYTELSNPDNPGYWDAWDSLLREAKYIDANGLGDSLPVTWTLHQDDSLFAVSEQHNWGDGE